MKKTLVAMVVLVAFFCNGGNAADTQKLKAVMYVGGGFHDYKKMRSSWPRRSARSPNVSIDIKSMASAEEMAAAFADPSSVTV